MLYFRPTKNVQQLPRIKFTWRTQVGLKLPQIITLYEQSTSFNVFDITDEFRPRDETLHSLFHNH